MEEKIAVLFQAGNYSGVIHAYEKNGVGLTSAVHYLVAVSYLFEDKFSEGLSILLSLKKDATLLLDYWCYLALAQLKNGDYKGAKRAIDKTRQRSKLYFEINVELSIKLGKGRRAMRLIREAKASQVHSAPLEINEAILQMHRRQLKLAENTLLRLLSQDPLNIAICDNLIRIYSNTRSSAKSECLIQAYLKQHPNHLPYLWHLVSIYAAQGRKEDMAPLMKRIHSEGDSKSYLREIFAIPSMLMSQEDIAQVRQRIDECLTNAMKKNEFPMRADAEYRATPFYLSYHQECNKGLFEKIATVFQKGLLAVPKLNKRPIRKRKKIAFISQHFYKQSVMDFYFHTIVNMPKEFHVTIINVEPVFIDAVTKSVYDRADEVLQPSISHDELVPLVYQAEYDMIIYPEIGMSPCIYYLAMQRLAPIQAVLMGHPDTSGMAAMDYYVSWKHFHHGNTKKQFTETVVQLKHMPICYDYPKGIDGVKKSLSGLGLVQKEMKLFSVPMLLFKIQPVFDEVIEKIIIASSNHVVLLVCYNHIEKVIKKRLEKRLNKRQLEQVRFELPFKKRDYYALLKNSNVILESFPFGGGNTVLHSMAAGTPVICMKSDQLKGSFGTGFYEWINETDYIANSIDEYVRLAINIANNDDAKSQYNTMIQHNKSKLFGNMDGPNEFYQWLRQVLP